jgi:hypothetical protein
MLGCLVLMVLSLGLIGYGSFLISDAVGFIVSGLILLFVSSSYMRAREYEDCEYDNEEDR